MRIPTQPLKIGITGRSCTGKTIVANQLHAAIGGKLRNCGELIKAVAKAEKVSVADLSVDQHRAFDLETRQWIDALSTTAIVEGSYLDRVLDGVAGVFLVRLKCELLVRVGRLGLRKGGSATTEEMTSRDEDEDALRCKVYGVADADCLDMVEIDTTYRSQSEVVKAISDLLSS